MTKLAGRSNLDGRFVISAFKVKDLPKDRRPQVAFCGRSNVGKSSLLNRLVGKKGLAKTSGTPGKTRSLNVFEVAAAMYFVDLPGFGYAKVSKAMRHEWSKLFDAYFYGDSPPAAVIALFDSRREPNPDDIEWLVSLMDGGTPVGVVLTKADKLKRNERVRAERTIEKTLPGKPLWFSAVTGEGKQQILKWIDSALEKR